MMSIGWKAAVLVAASVALSGCQYDMAPQQDRLLTQCPEGAIASPPVSVSCSSAGSNLPRG
jgi:hypothetical protein